MRQRPACKPRLRGLPENLTSLIAMGTTFPLQPSGLAANQRPGRAGGPRAGLCPTASEGWVGAYPPGLHWGVQGQGLKKRDLRSEPPQGEDGSVMTEAELGVARLRAKGPRG